MAKFKKGDRIMIRRDANSQFRGRIGIVTEEPKIQAGIFGYIVKIEAGGFSPACQVMEKDMEAVSEK